MKKKIYLLTISGVLSLLLLTPSSYPQEPQETQDKELQQGIWHYRHENYEEALIVLKAVRERNPESSLAAYYLGITYKQLQDYKNAKPHLEAAVNLKPKIIGALIELVDLLYRLDEVEEAKTWIEVAEKEEIRPAQVAFLKGLVLVKEGKDLEKGVDSLEIAKQLDSSLTQVADYHTGIAHLKAKKLKEAKKIFREIVIQDPTTDLASFANQYMDAIARREELMRPFNFRVSVAHQYDDNVILKPDDTTLATNITDKSDSRQAYTFRGEYEFRPLEHFGTKLGYAFYYAKQFDLGFYDTVNNNFALQPSLYLKDVAISFPANYNHVIVNDKNYLSSVSVGNLNNIMFAKHKMLQTSFAYKYKDYLWPPTTADETRDANEYLGWLAWYWFFAENEGFVNLKYTMNFDDTEGNNWEYLGYKATASSLIPLFKKCKLTVVGEFFLQNFLNNHTIYDKKRCDTVYTLSSLLAIELLKGTELQLQYTFIDNGSNINIYDYRRNVYSVALQYKF